MRVEDLRNVFKHLKHRKPACIFCPRCASQKIHLSSGLDLWLTPQTYVCYDCGYRGLIVMELEEEKQADKEDQESV